MSTNDKNSAAEPERLPCRQCGPGYRIGDDGCRHTAGKNKIDFNDPDFNDPDFNDPEFFGVYAVREGMQIPVAELHIGDEIITNWNRKTGRVITSKKVTDRAPCDGGNGMHVHINKNECYDSRSMVWVK